MKKLAKDHILLLTIIILAAFLRLYMLSTIPIGFNDDEAAFGYNAYSVLKTGRDEWGRTLPFPMFESFGDWKLVFHLYLVAISEFFFSATVFATRLPSAIIGIFAVLATYLFAKVILNKKIALLSALFLAISPWHIAASRNAFESDLLIFTITLGAYFFLKGTKERKFYIPSFAIFAISFYIYRSAWVFVPLLVLALMLIYSKRLRGQKAFLLRNILFFFLILTPLVPAVASFKGQSRFFQESFITGVQKTGIINDVDQRRGACQTEFKGFICSAVYNKYNFFATKYFNNFISNISPQTYYQDIGSTGYQAFAPRGYFYTFEYLLLLVGLVSLLKANNDKSRLLVTWILIAVISPSLTSVGNPGRLNVIMPAPQIISAAGFFYLFDSIKKFRWKYLYVLLTSAIVIASFSRFVVDALTYYPLHSARYQRYGYKELFTFLEKEKSKHSQIAISRRSDEAKQYIHYLFFTKYDPEKYHSNAIFSKDKLGWESVDRIDNISFSESTPTVDNLPPDSLIVTGAKEVSADNLLEVYAIDDPRGDRLFNVYTIKPNHHEN